MGGSTGHRRASPRSKAVKAARAETVPSEPDEKPLRPSQCREHMRKTLAKEFRGIVKGFVAEARRGSCQHVKLATELLERPTSRRTRTKSGSAAKLLESFESKYGKQGSAAK